MILKVISVTDNTPAPQTTSTKYVDAPIITYDRTIDQTEIEIELQDYNFQRLGILTVESPAVIYLMNDNGATIDKIDFFKK